MAEKKRDLSKAEMAELYRDLKKNMAQIKGGGAAAAAPKADKSLVDALVSGIRSSMKKDDEAPKRAASTPSSSRGTDRTSNNRPSRQDDMADFPPVSPNFSGAALRGNHLAVAFVILFAVIKVVLSAVESAGSATVTPAEASVTMPSTIPAGATQYGPEELKVLTQLDQRRVQLEQRASRISEKEREFATREQEYQVQLAQMRDLTERLKTERDKSEKKRSTQVDQLANVYSSMQPQEAAKLIEQLDVQIGLTLLQRMPEKRIGQILALMTPERALAITRILSGKSE